MRLLFELDKKDYLLQRTKFVRNSARAVVVKDGKLLMVHSAKYDFCKFPGGGIEKDEDPKSALIREVREETGYDVLPDSIRRYGYVHRIQKGRHEDVFIQDNYYYFCSIAPDQHPQKLDEYEADEQFTPVFLTPEQIIGINRTHPHGAKDAEPSFAVMIDRDTHVVEMLVSENRI